MNSKQIGQIREFNRFYTVFMGLLNKTYLKSRYTLVEIRVVHAILQNNRVSAFQIANALNIDKSYLSRILKRLEQNKIIRKTKSKTDQRALHLSVTPFGNSEFQKLTTLSNNHIGQLFSTLKEHDIDEIVQHMVAVKQKLQIVDPDSH